MVRRLDALENHLNDLLAQHPDFFLEFQAELFGRCPHIKAILAGTDDKEHAGFIKKGILSCLRLFDQPGQMLPQLKRWGAAHERHGITPMMFDSFKNVLIEQLRRRSGDGWTEEIESAWQELSFVTIAMLLAGYSGPEDPNGTPPLLH